jgi:hypothetical protein
MRFLNVRDGPKCLKTYPENHLDLENRIRSGWEQGYKLRLRTF